jgi:hypothetical protein
MPLCAISQSEKKIQKEINEKSQMLGGNPRKYACCSFLELTSMVSSLKAREAGLKKMGFI